MLARFQREWMYNNVASNSVQGLLEEGLVTAARAAELNSLLADPDRVAASLASVAAGRVENVAMALACDCALLYREAANCDEGERAVYLKLAARAMLLEHMPEPFIRVSVSALMDKSRRLSWGSQPPSKAC